MKLRARVRRWRLLRSTPLLTPLSHEGALVQTVGRARILGNDPPIVPPLSGVPCVVAWTKIQTGASNNRNNPLLNLERTLIRPFTLDTGKLTVVVDAGFVDLLLPIHAEGRTEEIAVRDGQIVTVIGTVLRDGAERPDGDRAFRESTPTIKLVGSRRRPVVITA